MTALRYKPFFSNAHRRGQILVITLLGLTLLVGLAFYVYNVGHQVNQRIATQHSADAAAVSGADWLARSMNVTAMNNVGISKLLASVVVLDSIPLATRMSLDELTDLEAGLAAQIARGNLPSPLDTAMANLDVRMKTETEILTGVDQALSHSTFSMDETTTWSVPGASGLPPHGKLWQAMAAMDSFSQAAMDSSGLLAQKNAVRWGMQTANIQAAWMTPVLPQIPVERGQFSDFEPTLRGQENVTSTELQWRDSGGAGGAIPDYLYPCRLGPWARLLVDPHNAWHTIMRKLPSELDVYHGYRNPMTIPGSGGSDPTWSNNVPGLGGSGSRVARSGGGTTSGVTSIGYTTYGPYRWQLNRIYEYANGTQQQLGDTFFYRSMRNISGIKLEYMFGSNTLVKVHYPLWITDYAKALELSQTDTRILYTKYYSVESFEGLPAGQTSSNVANPIDTTMRGWVPADGRSRSLRGRFESQINALVYRIIQQLYSQDDPDYRTHITRSGAGTDHVTWTYTTRNEQVYEMTFSKVADYVWKIEINTPYGHIEGTTATSLKGTYYFTFGGIDVGGEVEVTNPCNWDSTDSLPRPTLLAKIPNDDPAQVASADTDYRWETFAFLGAAGSSNIAPLWKAQFDAFKATNTKNRGSMVAVAQAELFNNSSWDLWTQDWRAQLVPVTRWEDWVSRVQSDAPLAANTDGAVLETNMDTLQEDMSRANGLTDYLTH